MSDLENAYKKYEEERAAVAAGETEIEYGPNNELGLKTEKQSRRESRMSFEQRCRFFIETVTNGGYFDPDICPRQPVPPEAQKAMEDELGMDFINEHKLSLVFHFWVKRWVVIQPASDGKGGTGHRIVYLCCGPKIPGYCPPDLDDDAHFDALVGAVGDFKIPDRKDFQMVKEMVDPAIRGKLEDYARARIKEAVEKEKSKRRDMDNFAEGWMDYHGNAIIREANQNRGSMQGYHKIPGRSRDEIMKDREEKYETKDVFSADGTKLYSIKKRIGDVPNESIERLEHRLIVKAAKQDNEMAINTLLEEQQSAFDLLVQKKEDAGSTKEAITLLEEVIQSDNSKSIK